MPPAARITDMHVCPLVTPGTPPIPHVGGPVIVGHPTVLIVGMPAARIGDQCTCVGPPDAIAMGSPTVLIGGKPAARLGDPTVHGGTIVSGAPNVLIGVAGAAAPPALSPALVPTAMVGQPAPGEGPPPVAPAPARASDPAEPESMRRLGGNDSVDIMYFDPNGAASAKDGRLSAEGTLDVGLLRMDHYRHMGWAGAGHSLEVMTADAEIYGSVGWTGAGVEAEASTRFKKEGASLALGPDENNPFARIDGEYELLTAEAKGRLLIGSDGREAGLEIGGVAEAAALSGEAKGEVSFRIPFTDTVVALSGKADGSVGDVAIGGNIHAKRDEDGIYRAGAKGYFGGGATVAGHAGTDTTTGRTHLGAKVGLKAVLGGKLDFDLSWGPAYETRDRNH